MQESTDNSSMPNVRKNEEFKYSLLKNMRFYFGNKIYNKVPADYYNVYSLIGQDDPDRKRFSKIFDEMKQSNDFNPAKLGLTPKQSRGIGSFLGMAICDALGACTEFQRYKKQGHGLIKNGFADVYKAIKQRKLSSRHGEITTWTDDASMGIAMAFSLLLNQYQFDPIHIRYMFILWLCHGLGNGGRKHSIGLGGNIKISMDEFFEQQTQFASQGYKVKNFNNGNGSLMRLATIPVAFHDDKQKAMDYSALQSRTTHNGFEAEQCCRLLAAIIVEMINRDEGIQKSIQNQKMQIEQPQHLKSQNKQYKNQQPKWKAIFDKVCQGFKPKQSRSQSEQKNIEKNQNNFLKYKSVQFLAKSQQQPRQLYQWASNEYKQQFKNFNNSQADRNWNWKSKQFQYSDHRNKQMPGYIGSYCMDGFAMALHTVWKTNSFKQCAIMNADMGGDCDTVGSIAGQMAGAIYGVDEEMLRLYSEMKDFQSKRFEAFLLGYKLVNRKGQSIVKQFPTNEQQIVQNNGKKRQSSSEQRNEHHQQKNEKNSQKRVKKH